MALLKFVVLLGMLGRMACDTSLENQSDNFEPFFPLIVGGVDAPPTLHMVGLLYGVQIQFLMCGGSVIAKRATLTAAHCIVPMITWNGELIQSFNLIVGTSEWNRGGHVAHIKAYHVHPEYNSAIIKNDIGLLKTHENLLAFDNVKLIPLVYKEIDSVELCYVTGWGTTRLGGPTAVKLQILHVYTLTQKQCQIESERIVGPTLPVHHHVEICTLHKKGEGYGMCHGDSGSALVLKKKKGQIGIVSWGYPCARGIYDVFTRVSAFEEIIKKWLQ